MRQRLRAEFQGAVQGVGFRPFVFNVAEKLGLDGWVSNDNQGLTIEVEGTREDLERFLVRVVTERPVSAVIASKSVSWSDPLGYEGFEIRRSDCQGDRTVQIVPELATCPSCLEELFDPGDRRHRYPFTNCTRCGPRFSIVLSLPYDRPRTTMERFEMCAACEEEYTTPSDRRFHAQPNACPECGPRLSLWQAGREETATGDEALKEAVLALEEGKIVAVKGLGGFHLMVDARNGAAVLRLRERKPRRKKPFALMVKDLEQARELCRVGRVEAEALTSPEAPIVLLPRRPGAPVDDEVAPGN
ncbi:MAG: acylphosphatase, partial [Planctomycetota bacterium]